MRQQGRLTREEENAKEQLLFKLNHGMRKSKVYLNKGRTMEKRRKEPEIYSMHCGYQICS